MTPNPLKTGYAPTWAHGWGQDRYGLFTEIKLGKVVQLMRWIPPGTFQMGSPEDEQGRFNRMTQPYPVLTAFS
jgi:formylglycine-generating enzyme required for sulfatase activity